jgi:homoserine dehydrogenase
LARKESGMTFGQIKTVTLVGQGPLASRVYGLLQGKCRVNAVARYDEASAAGDAVVECVGGVSPAYDVAMAALGRGIPLVTANSLLMAVHGRILQAASDGQHAGLFYNAALGVARPMLHWLRQEAPVRMTLALATGANAVLERMEHRNELAADAERALTDQGHALHDVSGKQTLAQALTLYGACTGQWLGAGVTERQGLEQVEVADLARLRRFGLRLCYGAEIARDHVRAGLLAVGAESALNQCFARDVLVAENALGEETVLTREVVNEEATAQALAADALKALAVRPRVFAIRDLPRADSARPWFVRVAYAQREALCGAGFAVRQETVDGHGIWTAVGTCKACPSVADGLCVAVSGAWEPRAGGLRLVG